MKKVTLTENSLHFVSFHHLLFWYFFYCEGLALNLSRENKTKCAIPQFVFVFVKFEVVYAYIFTLYFWYVPSLGLRLFYCNGSFFWFWIWILDDTTWIEHGVADAGIVVVHVCLLIHLAHCSYLLFSLLWIAVRITWIVILVFWSALTHFCKDIYLI